MPIIKRLILTILISGLFVTEVSLADTRMNFKSSNGNASDSSAVMVKKSLIRMNDQDGRWTLFDAGKDILYIVEPDNQQYSEMTRDDIRQLGTQMKTMRQKMAQQMESMSPEQRAMMEQMMGKNAFGEQPEPRRYESTGKKHKVSGYACETGRVIQGNETLETYCLADPDEVGLSREEYEAIRAMYDFMSEMQSASSSGGQFPDYKNLNGVPIEIKGANNSSHQWLTEKSNKRLSKDLFTIPEGYTKVDPYKQR